MGCVLGSDGSANVERGVRRDKKNQSIESSTSARLSIKAGMGGKQQGAKELKRNYQINKTTKVIGCGAFGKVFATFNLHNKSQKVAIKVMDKEQLAGTLDNVMDEISLLNRLDHPNIVNYFETYNDLKFIYLVMEFVDGMPLFDKITSAQNQTFSEAQACRYMKQLF